MSINCCLMWVLGLNLAWWLSLLHDCLCLGILCPFGLLGCILALLFAGILFCEVGMFGVLCGFTLVGYICFVVFLLVLLPRAFIHYETSTLVL